jgi:hypothetical protein
VHVLPFYLPYDGRGRRLRPRRPPVHRPTVSEVREQLRLAAAGTGAPHMLLRFGYATPAPGTGRRTTIEVIDSGV